MNSSGPSSDAESRGSSLAFVKPMPKRDGDAPADGTSSVNVPFSASDPASTTDLWSQLQPIASGDGQQRSTVAACQLGHFRVEEQIGRGGMGAVFRAVDTRLDRVVALKVLSPLQSTDESSIERFRNEARAAARMDHDNIARVYYVGEDRGLSFIAFEFVHGANIRQLIEQQRTLSPADAINYTLQIAAALRHTDAAGVVHRDIKPSNIIITPGGRAKLVDLGLARKRDPQAAGDLTMDGTTLGTFDYISPEQAKDPRNVDVRSDIYSLGCTLYHMLVGRPPYPVGTMLQKLLDHQGKEIPDAAAANPRVPPELSAVVRKMMASDPRDRYASPEDLIDDLSLIAHRFGLRPAAVDGVAWSKPRPGDGWNLWKQYSGWLVTAVFLLMVVLVIDRAPRSDRRQQAAADTPDELVDPIFPRDVSDSGGSSTSVSAPGAETILREKSNPREEARTDSRSVPPNASANPLADSGENEIDGGLEASSLGALKPLDDVFAPPSPGLFTPSVVPSTGGGPARSTEAAEDFPNRATSDSVPSIKVPSDGRIEVTGRAAPEQTLETSRSRNPFVVFVNSVEQEAYPTLQAAIAGAPDNAYIELQYDGDQLPAQPPLRIQGRHLRLRASKDYRPTLRFAVPPERRLPGREEQVRLLSVSGGSLEMYNIDLQLVVDSRLNIGQWILLSLADVEHLELHGVSITLENQSPRSAAIIELAERVRAPFSDAVPTAVRIEATDCFFRGEGDLILDKNVDPVRLQFRNAAIALGGALVRMEGTDAYLGSADMNTGHDIELELNHVTAILKDGVAAFDVQRNHSVPKLVVDAGDTVISSAAPLVTMQGELALRDFHERLMWSDDATYLQGPEVLWRITASDETEEFDRDHFDAKWGRSFRPRPFETLTNLLSRRPDQPFSNMSSVDLQLNDRWDNPAREGASDRTNAGVDWREERLPRFSGGSYAPEGFPSLHLLP